MNAPTNLREAVAHLTRHPRVTVQTRLETKRRCFQGLRDGRLRFGELALDLRPRNGHEVGLAFGCNGILWTWGDDSVAVYYHSYAFAPRPERPR